MPGLHVADDRAAEGAEITHAGVLANLRGTWRTLTVPERVRAVSFLPLAHLLERYMSLYAAIVLAGTVTCRPAAALAGFANRTATALFRPLRSELERHTVGP